MLLKDLFETPAIAKQADKSALDALSPTFSNAGNKPSRSSKVHLEISKKTKQLPIQSNLI